MLPARARFDIVVDIVLQVAILGSMLSAAARGQGVAAPAPRLSPTLYFADSSEELSRRAALHARVDPLVRSIADADSSALLPRLREANQALVALERHDAYLK